MHLCGFNIMKNFSWQQRRKYHYIFQNYSTLDTVYNIGSIVEYRTFKHKLKVYNHVLCHRKICTRIISGQFSRMQDTRYFTCTHGYLCSVCWFLMTESTMLHCNYGEWTPSSVLEEKHNQQILCHSNLNASIFCDNCCASILLLHVSFIACWVFNTVWFQTFSSHMSTEAWMLDSWWYNVWWRILRSNF